MISTDVTIHTAYPANRVLGAHVADSSLTVKLEERSTPADLVTRLAFYGEPGEVLALLDELRAIAQKAVDVAALEQLAGWHDATTGASA